MMMDQMMPPNRDLHRDGMYGSTADPVVYPQYCGLNYNKHRSSHVDLANTDNNTNNTTVMGSEFTVTPRLQYGGDEV